MPQKRNKFFTFVLSCFPGAGQMFLGFMKTGTSLMVLFFGVLFVANVTRIYEADYLLPIIWFYAFFDAVNKEWSSNESFAKMEDHYLFSSTSLSGLNTALHGKGKLILGIAIILIGLKALWDTSFDYFASIFGVHTTEILNNLGNSIPRILFAVIIIVIGIFLIAARKRSSENDD